MEDIWRGGFSQIVQSRVYFTGGTSLVLDRKLLYHKIEEIFSLSFVEVQFISRLILLNALLQISLYSP